MRRTQLYLEEDTWRTLRIRSRRERTTISELVRRAVREKYLGSAGNRAEMMRRWAGIWRDRRDLPGAESYVRQLRRGGRLRRLSR